MRRRLCRLVWIIALWLTGVAGWIAIGPAETSDRKADAAIVLGAAVDGSTPSPVFQQRIAHAIALYRQGQVSRIVFTGGQSPEDTLSEAEVARTWAMAHGVPPEAILTENQSRTTFQNLQYSRPILSASGIEEVLIVSDPLHLRRALLMSKSLGLEGYPSPTPTSRYRSLGTQIPFLLRETYFVHHFWFFGK